MHATTPIVLVHGNPECDAVWDLLAPHLPAVPVRLSPPGFGAPVPAGFEPSPDAYLAWLVAELEAIGRPVHLVGHDFGGGHVVGVAVERPDLVVSWASDVLGVFDPGYVWHPLAQIWRTPEEGERWIEAALAAPPAERARRMTDRGADPGIALRVAEAFDAAMGACILPLYRAAEQNASRIERLEAAAARPGLAIVAEADEVVGTLAQRERAAARAGARVARLPGRGHWWMTEDEGRDGAAALRAFWAGL